MSLSFAEQLSGIQKSHKLAVSLERAYDYARGGGRDSVTLEHLLLALTEDPEAIAVLQACNVDLDRLRTDVAGYIGRLTDQPASGSDPVAAPLLVQIVKHAEAAAKQSGRPQLNSAIVLAAIVGDGTSDAADLLLGQGLTFQGALAALQDTSTEPAASVDQPAPVQPAPVHPEPAQAEPAKIPQAPEVPAVARRPVKDSSILVSPRTTEDVLASVRERIEARKGAVLATTKAMPEVKPAAPATVTEEEPGDQAAAPPSAADLADKWARAIDGVTGDAAEAPQAPQPAPISAEPVRRQEMPEIEPWPEASTEPHPPQPQQFQPRQVGTLPPGQGSQAPAFPPGINPAAPSPYPAAPPPAGHAPNGRVPGGAFPGGTQHQGVGQPPMGQPPAAPMPAPMPASVQGRPRRAKASGVSVEPGQLIETIPRIMRVAVPVTVEVRIARNSVEAPGDGMQGQVAPRQHDLLITKAMSVKLRAPDSGFWIETASPETQWIENKLGVLHDDFASWRWTVTPQHRGVARLQLIVSARTVGTDGLAAETQLPDQVFTVKVRMNYRKSFKKLGGWALAALAGGVISAVGGSLLDAQTMQKLLAMIGQ